MRKIIFKLIVYIVWIGFYSFNSYAALTMLSKDISEYPIVKAKFLPIDNWNRIVPELSKSEFLFLDNGIEMPINSFTGCIIPSQSASVAISFDLSIGHREGNNIDFDYSKQLLEQYLSFINMDSTEVALLSFDKISIIESDFTSETNELATIVNNFKQSSYANIYSGLTSLQTGAIDFLLNSTKNIKSILLVTQNLVSKDEAELIIAKAKLNNIKINILYISDYIPYNIQYIADMTGGYVVSKTEIEKKRLAMLASMAKISEGVIPYTISGKSFENCDGIHTFTIKNLTYLACSFDAKINRENLQYLEAKPEWLSFASIKPGTTFEKTIIFTVKNSSVSITDIKLTHPDFSIKSITPNIPVVLVPEETIEVKVEFAPKDSSIVFSQLIIVSNACYGDTINITGGYPNSPPKTSTVDIIKPICDEVLVIGDTMEITWTGLLPKDVIQLEYSFTGKNNNWDTLAKNVTNLHYKWPVPNVETDSFCIKAIQLWPNNVYKTYNLHHNTYVRTAFFNNSGEKVITTSADSVFIWNASGNVFDKPLYTFGGLNDSATWAIYVFDHMAMEDKYIGVTAGSYVYLYDINNNYNLLWSYNLDSSVNSIELSNDSKYAVVSANNGYATIFETNTGKIVSKCKLSSQTCRYAQFHPNKYEIMTISSNDGIIRFYDINGKKIDSIDAKEGAIVAYSRHATYNYNGTKIAFANISKKKISVYDRNTKQLLYSIKHPPVFSTETEILFSNFFFDGVNEYLLTSGNQDNVMRRWYASNGVSTEKDDMFDLHTNLINTGTFSFDGKRVLSASNDKTAIIWNLDQRILQADTTCLLRIGRAKAAITNDTIYLGETFINELNVRTFNNIISNICDFKYNIRSIRIIGRDAVDFGIIDELNMPYMFAADSKLKLNLFFKPTAIGERFSTLEIIIPADTIYVVLKGIGIPNGLNIVTNLIDFKEVFIDDIKDSLVSIAVNVSDKVININNIYIEGIHYMNYREFFNKDNSLLNPNDTLKIPLRFIPFDIGKKNAILKIEHDYNDLLLKSNLFGEGINIIIDTIRCYINNIEGEVGQKVELPIYYKTETNWQNLSINKLFVTLVFNSSMLAPINESNEIDIIADIIDSNRRRSLLIALPYKPGEQVFNGLRFIVALGNNTHTNLELKYSYCEGNSRVYIETIGANFELKNICNADGERLFDEYGRFNLMQNTPNPVISTTKINYEILENGYVSLKLFDIRGVFVKNLFEGRVTKGNYSIELNANELEPGTYFYILETKTQRKTKVLTISN